MGAPADTIIHKLDLAISPVSLCCQARSEPFISAWEGLVCEINFLQSLSESQGASLSLDILAGDFASAKQHLAQTPQGRLVIEQLDTLPFNVVDEIDASKDYYCVIGDAPVTPSSEAPVLNLRGFAQTVRKQAEKSFLPFPQFADLVSRAATSHKSPAVQETASPLPPLPRQPQSLQRSGLTGTGGFVSPTMLLLALPLLLLGLLQRITLEQQLNELLANFGQAQEPGENGDLQLGLGNGSSGASSQDADEGSGQFSRDNQRIDDGDGFDFGGDDPGPDGPGSGSGRPSGPGGQPQGGGEGGSGNGDSPSGSLGSAPGGSPSGNGSSGTGGISTSGSSGPSASGSSNSNPGPGSANRSGMGSRAVSRSMAAADSVVASPSQNATGSANSPDNTNASAPASSAASSASSGAQSGAPSSSVELPPTVLAIANAEAADASSSNPSSDSGPVEGSRTAAEQAVTPAGTQRPAATAPGIGEAKANAPLPQGTTPSKGASPNPLQSPDDLPSPLPGDFVPPKGVSAVVDLPWSEPDQQGSLTDLPNTDAPSQDATPPLGESSPEVGLQAPEAPPIPGTTSPGPEGSQGPGSLDEGLVPSPEASAPGNGSAPGSGSIPGDSSIPDAGSMPDAGSAPDAGSTPDSPAVTDEATPSDNPTSGDGDGFVEPGNKPAEPHDRTDCPIATEPTSPPLESQLITIDFTVDGTGQAIAAGTFVNNQFKNLGVTLSVDSRTNLGMVFDGRNITGGDTDLAFGSNLLIISEDGNSQDPDDDALGGVISFEFDSLTNFFQAGVLDIESPGSYARFYREDQYLATVFLEGMGDNSYQQIVSPAELDFDRVTLYLNTSGGVTEFSYGTIVPGGGELVSFNPAQSSPLLVSPVSLPSSSAFP